MIPVPEGYQDLAEVLAKALSQAAEGKGRDRHARGDTPFSRQPILEIGRMVGPGFAMGQAIKKTQEATRLKPGHAEAELLGAINYLAAAVLLLRERVPDTDPSPFYAP